MKRILNLSVLLSVLVLTSSVFASPASWLSTRYRATPQSTGSWYRSPVTDGHLDIRVLAEAVSFTDAEFSIRYDSSIVDTITTANVWDVASGLTVVSVATVPLEGTWKESTITLTGTLSIGSVQYESEATLLQIRFVPHAEGTMPITLWPSDRFPESYYNCSLKLWDNGVEVEHGPKEWNDGTTLFTFTDKTASHVMYHYDMNFGTPVAGYLQVVYEDESVEEFHVSDHDRGITINPEFGAYFVTAQPNAVSHSMIFAGYQNWENMDMTNLFTWSISHSQPDGFLFVPEIHEGLPGLDATTDDIVLTISQPGIGLDFEGSDYMAALAGHQQGVLSKTFEYNYVDDDTIALTIIDGLEPDQYDLYIYKDGLVLGRTWFGASASYPVTFTILDEMDNPLPNVSIIFEIWGMDLTIIKEQTNEDGQAVFQMHGNNEWGAWYEYKIIASGFESVADFVEVYDSPVEVTVIMLPADGVTLADFAHFASWWQTLDCGWHNDDCEGADMNFDGSVDMDDLVFFVARWLQGQ
ncbi:MAG TPA: hypothetical protein ENN97_04080 [Phycisphaerales bacterium]|nr:hypothetical protein [Phycisphaerales bacterium]